jgi:hypothetical protein
MELRLIEIQYLLQLIYHKFEVFPRKYTSDPEPTLDHDKEMSLNQTWDMVVEQQVWLPKLECGFSGLIE